MPTDVPTRTETELASALRLSVMRLARRLRAQRDNNLSLNQVAALATVERHGPMTPGELADHEKVQPPSMTRILASLEAAGLLARTPHPTDGRQALLALSPSGAVLLREDRRRRDAWLARRMKELQPGELEVLAKAAAVLDRLAGG
ncbi:MAG: MarR family transcriptional regulator [Actinomycetota bacterium]|nr:MarR family transcriptional regulator [Actinomycetota bacterium]